jgi:hypothetical protein
MDRTTWIVIGVVGAAALIALYFIGREPTPETVAVEEVAEEVVEEPIEPVAPPPVDVPPAVSTTEPPVPTVPVAPVLELPPLDESDLEVKTVLADTVGEKPVESFLVPEQVVRKIVVTLDNLPNEKVAMRLRAVEPVEGRFRVEGGPDEGYVLDPANYRRYSPLVRTLEATEPEELAAAYYRYYPLLQEAYEELGYPGRQFHARVVAVIDDLLAAPDVTGPIELTRPKVMYQFADPRLEALSAGQKMMIRMGPDNAAIVKARLRALRAVLVGQASAENGAE